MIVVTVVIVVITARIVVVTVVIVVMPLGIILPRGAAHGCDVRITGVCHGGGDTSAGVGVGVGVGLSGGRVRRVLFCSERQEAGHVVVGGRGGPSP